MNKAKREPWQVPVLIFCLYAFPSSIMALGFGLLLHWAWLCYASIIVALSSSGVGCLILMRAVLGPKGKP